MSIKKLIVQPIFTDEEIKHIEGDYIDENFIIHFINQDTDVYKENGELLLKFRKNIISEYLCKIGYESFHKAPNKVSYSRGTAAGPIDINKLPKSVYKFRPMDKTEKGIKNTKNWTYYYKRDGTKAKDQISNGVKSSVVGYYEKFRGLPCRMTSFTKKNLPKFENGKQFIQEIDKNFKNLVYNKYQTQYKRANSTNFVIDNTAFSTFTVNKNFQTGVHKDAGDFKDGFGNLTVLEKGNYKGGYTIFPQYGVGVNVRQGDFLAMDVHEWHANSKIILENKDAERISFVCYLRNSIGNLCK